MRVSVDRDKCVGSGQCVMTVEEVFDQSEDDGIVVLLEKNPPDERQAAVRQAAGFCPAQAITVTDD